ncbi:MAG: hypothetical protein PHO02_02120 [Candidatus Nanoarchaeia archaeon]|nr:hypothetical protein [Candidatus Nanoarchaeia archaeon]
MAIPPLAIGGIIGAVILIATAVTGNLVLKGKAKMGLHKALAEIAVFIALAHGGYALYTILA